MDGFNKARCSPPNKRANAGFISNICILRGENRARGGKHTSFTFPSTQTLGQSLESSAHPGLCKSAHTHTAQKHVSSI